MYGPLIHEGQSASVVIGPIVCEGHNHVSLQSIVKTLTQDVRIVEGDLETLETGLVEVKETLQKNNETLEKLEELNNSEYPCKSLGGRYKFILDRCYYLLLTPKKLSDAKFYCSNIFSKIGRNGKLFEPVDINTFNTIKKTAATFGFGDTWIGFVRSDATNWNRISDGLPATKLWGSKDWSNSNYSRYRYMIFSPNSESWDDELDESSDSNPSICEAI